MRRWPALPRCRKKRAPDQVTEKNAMSNVPACPACGEAMKPVLSLPPEDGLPGVEGFRCEPCATEHTREVE